jgi:translation elongation factor EF-Ts
VLAMHRLAVGEGIEKPTGDDFHTEVMKQAGLA